ncbi:hypothetical protein K469DRAFT_716272 [Zopfia rhizophila CBS 207.26]|uniref:Uncharacterized protein n=1 Tax=Zopfia rhizophila CBS 207.26 TaxID=1314779 RepID=A0A6A6DPA5_9PEZI|nr:hypothetical protein K469DRAFT_716272 [Zopfia rhizophila CBS 207.26]
MAAKKGGRKVTASSTRGGKGGKTPASAAAATTAAATAAAANPPVEIRSSPPLIEPAATPAVEPEAPRPATPVATRQPPNVSSPPQEPEFDMEISYKLISLHRVFFFADDMETTVNNMIEKPKSTIEGRDHEIISRTVEFRLDRSKATWIPVTLADFSSFEMRRLFRSVDYQISKGRPVDRVEFKVEVRVRVKALEKAFKRNQAFNEPSSDVPEAATPSERNPRPQRPVTPAAAAATAAATAATAAPALSLSPVISKENTRATVKEFLEWLIRQQSEDDQDNYLRAQEVAIEQK